MIKTMSPRRLMDPKHLYLHLWSSINFFFFFIVVFNFFISFPYCKYKFLSVILLSYNSFKLLGKFILFNSSNCFSISTLFSKSLPNFFFNSSFFIFKSCILIFSRLGMCFFCNSDIFDELFSAYQECVKNIH